TREGARGFYDFIVPRPSFHTHAVDWYLRVLPLLGVPEPTDFNDAFVWLPKRPEIVASIQQKWPVASSRYFVLQPGARWANKRWPAEHFSELVCQLAGLYPENYFAILG